MLAGGDRSSFPVAYWAGTVAAGGVWSKTREQRRQVKSEHGTRRMPKGQQAEACVAGNPGGRGRGGRRIGVERTIAPARYFVGM
jgi:hypothetical protein